MSGPEPAVALTRRAARHVLRLLTGSAGGPTVAASTGGLLVGVSGGADSLALAAALAFEAKKTNTEIVAGVIDHGLQEGSRGVAEEAASQCGRRLGIEAKVRTVSVEQTGAGLEADARTARLAALRELKQEVGATHVALGHTGDDQAEQVFLGLLRGSGTRSMAGMRVETGDLLRPFLLGPPVLADGPVMRSDTVSVCASLGLEPWHDPHNEDPSFTRVRMRRILRNLERELPAPALRHALNRTADAAARDSDLLDRLAEEALVRCVGTADTAQWPTTWPVEVLTALDPALRIRALRRVLLSAGVPGSELTAYHLYQVEKLLIDWRGQGPLDLPGHLKVTRTGGEVAIWWGGRTQ